MSVFTVVKPSIWQTPWLGCDFCSVGPLEVCGFAAAAAVLLDWWAIRCYWIVWMAIDELAGVPVSRSAGWRERMWTRIFFFFLFFFFYIPAVWLYNSKQPCFSTPAPYRKLSLWDYGAFGLWQEVAHALGLPVVRFLSTWLMTMIIMTLWRKHGSINNRTDINKGVKRLGGLYFSWALSCSQSSCGLEVMQTDSQVWLRPRTTSLFQQAAGVYTGLECFKNQGSFRTRHKQALLCCFVLQIVCFGVFWVVDGVFWLFWVVDRVFRLFWVVDRVFWVVDRVFWVVDKVFCVVDRVFWVVDRVFWVVDRVFWVVDRVFWVVDKVFWVVDRVFWLFWVVDRVFWVVDRVLWVVDKVFWVVDRVFWVVDSVFWLFWVVDRVFWVVDRVFWVVDKVFCVVDRVFWVVDRVFWVVDRVFWVVDKVFWVVDRVFWLFWVVDRVFWVVDRVFWVVDSVFWWLMGFSGWLIGCCGWLIRFSGWLIGCSG